MRFDWSEDNIARLKQLREDGWSAAEIAKEIGATSRSAVIGKLYRLGVPPPEQDSVEARQRRHQGLDPVRLQASWRARKQERQAASRLEAKRQQTIADRALPTEPLSVFGGRGCRFPMWPDDRKPGDLSELVICGRERQGEHAYCPQHYRLAYVAPERRQAA